MHPMKRKARKQFEESLAERTPIRWLMIHQPRLRWINEAVRMFHRHMENYPDIAEAMNAEEILAEELMRERQAVLTARTKKDAINFLAIWYNRPANAMAYRYQAIKAEAMKMDSKTLAEEEKAFRSSEIKMTMMEDSNSLLSAMAESGKESIEKGSYTALAVTNLRQRIAELESKKQALEEERIGRTGLVKQLMEQIEKTENLITSIETVTGLCEGDEG